MANARRTGLHTTSGRWQLGVALSLGAVLMWGLLPIALSGLLRHMSAMTITWFRFVLAGAALAIPVVRSRGLAPALGNGRTVVGLLALATLALVANYTFYAFSLHFVPPSGAQVLIQLAPMCLLLGSLVVFRERLVAVQVTGLAVLLTGLVLFFHSELPALRAGGSPLLPGILLLFGAAVTWGIYALAQKQLLNTLDSRSIMVVIYLASSLLLLPFARPGQVAALDGPGLLLLAFLGFNTLAAYGCFSEALEHLEASRVSVVLSLTPLVTIAAVTVGSRTLPALVTREHLDPLSLAGAALVVAGSMMGALGRRSRRP